MIDAADTSPLDQAAATEHEQAPAEDALERDLAAEIRILGRVVAVLVRNSSRRTRRTIIQLIDELEARQR